MNEMRTSEAFGTASEADRTLRHDWTRAEAEALYAAPFNDLLYLAQTIHRRFFDPNTIQKSQLISIKTGGCAEDCGYCSQSAHHNSGLSATKLMAVERVLDEARRARDAGATRYCMGAAWRSPKARDMDAVVRHGGRRQGAGPGNLHDARHARRRRGRSGSRAPASTTTTTTSIPPSATTPRSSRRAPLPSAWRHWRASARPASRSAPAASRHGRGAGRPRRHAGDARQPAPASRKRADQHADRHSRHAARRRRAHRSDRVRAHDRTCAHPDAQVVCAPVGGAHGDERRDAGALLLRRRQLDLRRRHAADCGEP